MFPSAIEAPSLHVEEGHETKSGWERRKAMVAFSCNLEVSVSARSGHERGVEGDLLRLDPILAFEAGLNVHDFLRRENPLAAQTAELVVVHAFQL